MRVDFPAPVPPATTAVKGGSSVGGGRKATSAAGLDAARAAAGASASHTTAACASVALKSCAERPSHSARESEHSAAPSRPATGRARPRPTNLGERRSSGNRESTSPSHLITCAPSTRPAPPAPAVAPAAVPAAVPAAALRRHSASQSWRVPRKISGREVGSAASVSEMSEKRTYEKCPPS